MKPLKYLFLTSVLCLGVNALTSCNLWYDIESFFDDDTIVDWSPVELYITIEDRNGNDLLDTLYNSCIVDEITATFRGETLEVRKNSNGYLGHSIPHSTDTRLYMPSWHGLCLINQKPVWDGLKWNLEKTNKFMLYLGEIDASRDHDEDIVLHWGNGKTHTIHYHCSDLIAKKKEPSRNVWFSVDGKKQTDNSFKFVL